MPWFGRKPFCNGKPETAPHIGTFCFPICWRCLSIIIGAIIITIFSHVALLQELLTDKWAVSLVAGGLILPCFLDGVFSYFSSYNSKNSIRIMTGILCGIGLRITIMIFLGL